MNHYHKEIAEAKIALTECNLRVLHSAGESNLKVHQVANELHKAVAFLEGKQLAGLLQKMKRAMFETGERESIQAKATELVNHTHQLQYCLACRCISCLLMEDDCACAGCLYGAYVTTCENGIETRETDRQVVTFNENPIIRLTYHRKTGVTTAFVTNANGIEELFVLERR